MRLRHYYYLLLNLLALQAVPAFAVDDLLDLTIPASRVPTYSAGVDGGIPDTSGWTVVDVTDPPYNAVPADGLSDRTAIDTAISDAADNSIIYLPAGQYDLNNQTIRMYRSNVVLRGDGAGVTFITANDSGNTTCGNGYFIGVCGSTDGSEVNWTAGYTKGTTVVTLASVAGLSVGDWLELKQDNASYIDNPDGDDYMGHIARIDAINGSDVTLDQPLNHDFLSIENPTARKIAPIENFGIEDMTIGYESTAVTSYGSAVFQRAINGWITGVHWLIGANRHIAIQLSARMTIHGNEFETLENDTGSNLYAINLNNRSQNVLIENNIFHDNKTDINIAGGAHENVIAYNYRSSALCTRFASFHGHYPHSNLVEGNHADCHIQMDNYWGQQGPWNTMFRNRLVELVNKGIRTHRDNGVYTVATFANYINNITLGFWGEPGCSNNPPNCFQFAEYHEDLWGEKNLAHGGASYNKVDDSFGTRTTFVDMNAGTSAPVGWDGFNMPNSFYLPSDGASPPSWWRAYDATKPWPGIGANVDDIAGTLTKLPAQERFENASLAVTGSVTGASISGASF